MARNFCPVRQWRARPRVNDGGLWGLADVRPCGGRGVISIPGYHVVETLHAGPRAVVLRALRQQDGLPVICKLIGTDAANPDGLAAMRRDYLLVRRLHHPAIVEALDCAPHGAGLMIVFRDIGGAGLDRHLGGRPMSVEKFLGLAITLVDAVAAIHGGGVVHKDLNPANIVWNPADDRLNVIGFSIASELSQEETAAIRADAPAGTLAYIAPEQTGRLNRMVDYRADFYGLGATFYECLGGQPPFGRTDAIELIHSHIARTPAPLTTLNPAVPPVLAAIIGRMMAKDPEDRYQSTIGLRADLARCLEDWQAGGLIEPFPLGGLDVRSVLRVPQKLYGRADQQRQLENAFVRAAAGGHEILLIAGYAGIGKSMLVRELYKPVTSQHGFFIAGKFEQLKRDIPYAPWLRAFRDLMRQATAGGPDRAALWRERIVTALHPHGRVIAEVIPEVASLIGPQPPMPELGPAEAHGRFVHAFRRFVGAFAGPEHPLVIFLDDLQWADLASLKLLEGLAGDLDLRHFMIIGAYRDSEVDAAHPLSQTLSALHEADVAWDRLHLAELAEDAVTQLVADTLQTDTGRAQPLASALAAKTFGNPLFLGQYLETLERRGLIGFDQAAAAWTWDLAAIERQQTPDDVVTFLAQRFGELPEATLAAVKVAACIGSVFNLSTLAEVRAQSRQETAALLWPALRARMIVPLDQAYRYAGAGGTEGDVPYRFLHDRVQQAASSLLPEDEALACHLAVGRVLLRGYVPGDDRRLFDIVNQLNIARTLIGPGEERQRLIELNLGAGRRARIAAAYGPALAYLGTGLDLLGENAWRDSYGQALALHVETAEMAVVAGQDTLVFRLANAVQDRAADLLDRVKGYEVLIQLHLARQVLSEALRMILAALALLDSPLPARPTGGHIAFELWRTRLALRGRDENALVSRPATTDPRWLAVGRLLARAFAPAYLSDRRLYAMLVLRLTRLSATAGNQPASGFAYANYGATFGGTQGGAMFGRVALRLLDHLAAEQMRAQTLFVVKLFIEVWHRPVADALPGLLDAYRIGLETGELEYASYCLNNIVTQQFFLGLPLGQLKDTAAGYRLAAAKLNQETAAGVLKCYQQAIANLLGESATPTAFTGPHLHEAEDIPDLTSRRNLLGVEASYALLAYLNLLFGRLDDAKRYADLRRRYEGQTRGMVIGLRSMTIGGLIDLARWEQLSARERRAVLAATARIERRLQISARQAPANFDALLALVTAERLRATGRTAKAQTAYRDAIEAARRYGFAHDEAFACERSATLAGGSGDRGAMRGRLKQARDAYVRWGALAKVRMLDARYSELLADTMPRGRDDAAGARLQMNGEFHAVDMAALVRALQALSGEIRLGDLLRKLMRIVIANAGATDGHLLLQHQGGWRIEASALADEAEVRVLQGLPVETGEGAVLALAAVEEAARRAEPLVVADAAVDETLAADRYVARARPRSVLALPLVNRGQVTGILYLENNLAVGVFSPDKLKLLDLLSAQIAVSIENARLYDRLERMNLTLEQQVADRTRELEHKTVALTERTEALRAANSELKRLATTDALTGVSNRRGFLDVASKELERAARYRRSLSLLIMDIDHFKQINDGYGHSAGDEALRQVSDTIRAQIRSTDYFARIGGEEFALILPETDLDGAIYLAERIRAAVAAIEIHTGQFRFTLTISIGLAVIGANDVTTDQILARADQALYRAKAKGRNCVVAS